MKKIFSIFFVVVISLSSICCIRFTVSAEESINIDFIPIYYSGWYTGLSSFRELKRSMDMHISEINSDGEIFGEIRIYPYPGEYRDDKLDGNYQFTGNINLETGDISLQGTEWIDVPLGCNGFMFSLFTGKLDIIKRSITGTSEVGEWNLSEMFFDEFDISSGFELGIDNNSFIHSYRNLEGGFYGIEDYSLSDDYFNELVQGNYLNSLVVKAAMNDSWGGSCYGVSYTMGLVYKKMLSLDDMCDSDADTYFDLPKPCSDTRLLNTIQYYHLSQYLPNSFIPGNLLGVTFLHNTMHLGSIYDYIGESTCMFLHSLISLVKNREMVLFSYGHLSYEENDGGILLPKFIGHTIITVGGRYDVESGNYIITLYDLNTVSGDDADGEFIEMVINKTCTNFTLYDKGHNKTINTSDFIFMMINDIKKINDVTKLSPSSGTSLTYDTVGDSSELSHALIDITLEDDFIITSGDLNLQCSEGELSGNMGVYNIMPYISGDRARFYIEVDNYPDFTITPQSNHIDISIIQDDYYMSLEADNLDSAYCNIGERTLTMKGIDYNYKAFMGLDCLVGENEGALISAEGKSLCDITIDDNGGCAVITSNGTLLNDVTLKSYIGTDVFEKSDIPTTQEYVFSGEYKGQQLLYGDANYDGKVTAADALKVLRKSINLDKLDILKERLSDVNADGNVNSKDALIIQRYTVGIKNTGNTGELAE